ncbi:MAG: hypothetical protein A2Z95_08425 [Gallionellales bacterium GWA2_60_18]|nr:MAG: hypothetical protein A2Z95_08425 [Gallionellales bacterium GWA2_60_18]
MKTNELNFLVVEDDDFQRQMLVNMLYSLGAASISGACNGRQALEAIREADAKPVDIALCDLNMPEMDGMEFLRHLSQEHPDIAVIITSAVDSKLLASVGKMTRMYGVRLLGAIGKPIMPAQLQELISKHGTPENQRQQPAAAKNFTLDEILQGIRADQFEPFFQPKVDLKTGWLVGAEALARWLHPEHGVIGPYAFIPALEQSGNIDDLTFRILRKSASACRAFHALGHLLTISVNLSLVSLNDTALADRITRTVREAGIDPQYIVLEITESAAMTEVAPALENLARLCMNGFALSIDDYGTGYSSLQQLTRIAFSELKIDQSFIKDFSDNKALRIMVESSIDMAHKLMVKSVAEGVETQEDCIALKNMGCDTVQGYIIAEPMDLTAFGDFMEDHRRKMASMSQQTGQKQSTMKILVVEDDDFTRKIILQVLRDFGFSNTADAGSAESALKLLEAREFDLIVTDIDMPGMNGLKLIQLIRMGKTHAKPETRIMVLTSFSQTEVLSTALALDINGFLVKPIIPAVVVEKLTQAMSEHLHLRPPIAYEAVKTELKSLNRHDDRPSGIPPRSSITLGSPRTRNRNETTDAHHLSLQRLRPGMVLKENIRLKDGTLILSSGQTLSELSINRLIDLRTLLPANSIAIQEMPLSGEVVQLSP